MSKKRRKRRPRPAQAKAPAAEPAIPKTPPVPRRRRAPALDERPPAPWGSFPLVELVVLVAIVMLGAGLVTQGGRGPVMIGVGLVLGALAGLELSIREHFAGYRSHTLVLAGALAVAVLGALTLLTPALWLPLALAAAVAAFALVAWGLTRAFRRRSGQAFKVR
jgi:uncharacterized membrane protein